jgi:hypothetical protein
MRFFALRAWLALALLDTVALAAEGSGAPRAATPNAAAEALRPTAPPAAQARGDNGVIPPRPLETELGYPDGAHGDARVVLELLIDDQGHVTGAHAREGNEPFSTFAERGALTWRFEPVKPVRRASRSRSRSSSLRRLPLKRLRRQNRTPSQLHPRVAQEKRSPSRRHLPPKRRLSSTVIAPRARTSGRAPKCDSCRVPSAIRFAPSNPCPA